MRSTIAAILVAACAAAVFSLAPAAAQTDVSASDIQRLQEALEALEGEFARLQSRDAAAARTHEAELQEVRDELTYLRVKFRRGEVRDRSEYRSLRDRIDDLRSRVTATMDPPPATTAPRTPASSSTAPSTSSTSQGSSVIPVGQELDVRLHDALSSGTSQKEDRFIATTTVPLTISGRDVIPAGSEVRGVVSDVESAGRLDRKARLSLTFDQITINGRTYPIRGTLLEALEGGGYKKDAGRIGTGAGVGAIIGGILGGFKGALAGILIGGGGVVAATEGKEVELPAGTVLRLRLDSPPAVR